MPFADLARLRKCDFKDGVITYCRQKTGRQIRVHVTAEAAELIRQCADRRTGSPYLLNFNRKLKLLATALGLRGKLSSYTARHTWATTAFHTKVTVGVISNALGHSSVKVTETYLKTFENEALDKANKKIIAYVKKCGNR